MSDLQCPATFLVVGWDPDPGEADGAEPDLREARGQLPGMMRMAGVTGVPGGTAAPRMTGLAGLTELADELSDRRIAGVCSGRDAPRLAAAQALAAQLGVAHRSIEGLDPLPARHARAADPGAGSVGAGPPGAHGTLPDATGPDATGPDVTGPDMRRPDGQDPDGRDAETSGARHRAALDALADLHRGETVLVVTDAAVLTTLWPATPSPDGGVAPSSYRLVTVQVDGDGWRLLGRPGGG